MLNPHQPPPLARTEFDELLREHAGVIQLANELEFHLYDVGEGDPPDRAKVTACQQSAGELVRQLRAMLFRLDQQVYPRIDPGERAE